VLEVDISKAYEKYVLGLLKWWQLLWVIVCFFLKFTNYVIHYLAYHVINPRTLSGMYADLVACGPKQVAAVLRIVSDPQNLPVLIHCTAGKDRTGVMSCMILAAAGVSDLDIAHDYSLSHKAIAGEKAAEIRKKLLDSGVDESFVGAEAKTMTELFQHIHLHYGSFNGYLDHIGFQSQDRAKLRATLLEKI